MLEVLSPQPVTHDISDVRFILACGILCYRVCIVLSIFRVVFFFLLVFPLEPVNSFLWEWGVEIRTFIFHSISLIFQIL